MEKVMLSFDKVSAHYGKIQALHEVSLHINQGEIVTLIGANGAGKTISLVALNFFHVCPSEVRFCRNP